METPKHMRLRSARVAAGYPSATAAARAMNVNVPTYIHHENGTRDFSLEAAGLYADKLETTVAWLILGESDPPEPPKRTLSGFGRTAATLKRMAVGPAKPSLISSEDYHPVDIPEIIISYTTDKADMEGRSYFTRHQTLAQEAYHPISGYWHFPEYYVSRLGLDPNNTVILAVWSDSLSPAFKRDDRLFISTQVDSIMEEGYYLLSSSDGGLVVRYVEAEIFTSPLRLRISNGPEASKFDSVNADDLIVVGRVSGRVGLV